MREATTVSARLSSTSIDSSVSRVYQYRRFGLWLVIMAKTCPINPTSPAWLSAAISTVSAALGGAASLVLSTIVGICVFLVIMLAVAAINAVLSVLGLMLHPALGLILGAALTVIGVFYSVSVYLRIQFATLERLERYGLPNDCPELASLIAAEFTIACTIIAASVNSFYQRLLPADMIIMGSVLFGGAAMFAAFAFIVNRDPGFGRPGIRGQVWGPRISQLKKSRDVDGLVTALKSPDEGIRTGAAIALGCLGDARTIPALKELLNDPKWGPTRAAQAALVKLGENDMLPALVNSAIQAPTNLVPVIMDYGLSNWVTHELRKVIDAADIASNVRESARFALKELLKSAGSETPGTGAAS